MTCRHDFKSWLSHEIKSWGTLSWPTVMTGHDQRHKSWLILTERGKTFKLVTMCHDQSWRRDQGWSWPLVMTKLEVKLRSFSAILGSRLWYAAEKKQQIVTAYCAVFSSQLKSKVGNILGKAVALRIVLNIDGATTMIVLWHSKVDIRHVSLGLFVYIRVKWELKGTSLFVSLPLKNQCGPIE